MTKKLDQTVFDRPDCPDWAMSAAVDECNVAYYHNYKSSRLVAIKAYSDIYQGYHSVSGVLDYPEKRLKIGSGYDTTNWQNSAIDREV